MTGKWMLLTCAVLAANVAFCAAMAWLHQGYIVGRKVGRLVAAVGMGIYASAILWVNVFSRQVYTDPSPLLIPLASYWRVFVGADGALSFCDYHFSQVALNWLILAPLGSMLPVIQPKLCICDLRQGMTRCALVGFCLSIVTEALQLLLRRGFFEVDDILNNTLGCVAGYLAFRAMLHKQSDYAHVSQCANYTHNAR